MPRMLHHGHPESGGEDGGYQKLRELIITLKLAPGSPRIEADLSRRLGFSRTPIRSGSASSAGRYRGHLPKREVRSRAMVGPLTLADMKELYIIEGALEPEKRLKLVKEMKGLNNELGGLGVDGTAQGFRDASDVHLRFHRSFVEAAAGPRLMAQIEAVQAQVERYERAYTTALRTRFETSVAEHDAIIGAIAAGHRDAAEQAALSNWRNGAVRHGAIIASLGELGNWRVPSRTAANRTGRAPGQWPWRLQNTDRARRIFLACFSVSQASGRVTRCRPDGRVLHGHALAPLVRSAPRGREDPSG